MAQEIEIEFKNLLTKEEYERILAKLPFTEESQVQTNHYFETANFALKQNKCALRIREKNGQYTLTLKEPHQDGLLETHDHLSKFEAEQWLQGKIIPKEHTTKQLKQKNIRQEELLYYGALITTRHELQRNDIIYVLDYSIYNGHFDYELEIEAPSKTAGEAAITTLINELDICKRLTPNKIERFFTTLQKG